MCMATKLLTLLRETEKNMTRGRIEIGTIKAPNLKIVWVL